MKQKVIVKVSITDEKSRKKAMKTVVGHSASLQGQDKSQIEVVGDEIDSVMLTTLLRKSVGYADLVSVNPIPEEKDDKKDGGGDKKPDDGEKNVNEVMIQPPLFDTHYPSNGYVYVEFRDNSYDPNRSCNIM